MKDQLTDNYYSTKKFREEAYKMIDRIADHLERNTTNPTTKTINWNEPEDELNFWRNHPNQGDLQSVIEDLLKRIVRIHNPKYIGHQVAGPLPQTALTSMLSGMLNNGMAVYEMGMAPSAMELLTIEALAKKIGYDQNAGGLLTSGGSLANLTALLAARRVKAPNDVWNEGYDKPLGIMVNAEAHYSISRAAKIMGLGNKGLVLIPVKADYGMDTDLLQQFYQEKTKEGIHIFAIVGSAPSTATGSHDDLTTIAKFAKEKDIWFHVDGAHGGAAIFSEKYRHLLSGIEMADSVVIDGHKMMLMPTLTTALVYRNKWDAQRTFSQEADYLLDNEADSLGHQSGKKTFECTKTSMSLHWYTLLGRYGDSLFDDYVTRQYDLAREFADYLERQTDFEIAHRPQANILCFRFIDRNMAEKAINSHNENIRRCLLQDGTFYLVQTKLKGKSYLRVTLMNPLTTMEHLKNLLQEIRTVAKGLLLKM